jgi:hypothetical protein
VALGSTKSGVFSNCSSRVEDELHFTKCCADVFESITLEPLSTSSCGDLGWDPTFSGSNLVCANSKVSKQCSGQIGWDEADQFCKNGGARLCTLSELWANEAR